MHVHKHTNNNILISSQRATHAVAKQEQEAKKLQFKKLFANLARAILVKSLDISRKMSVCLSKLS